MTKPALVSQKGAAIGTLGDQASAAFRAGIQVVMVRLVELAFWCGANDVHGVFPSSRLSWFQFNPLQTICIVAKRLFVWKCTKERISNAGH
jgi:hypothetical protein